MKKKWFICIIILTFCFLLCSCKEYQQPVRFRDTMSVSLMTFNEEYAQRYSYNTPYILKESQAYKLEVRFHTATIHPSLIGMKYDDTIFDVVLLNPEAADADPLLSELEYQIICLKKCDITAFHLYRADYDYSDTFSDSFHTLVIHVE